MKTLKLIFENLDILLKTYNPTPLEKLYIATAKGNYAEGEKLYKKLRREIL